MKNKRDKLALSLAIMFFLTLLIPAQNILLAASTNENNQGMGESFDFTHTVLGEQATATTCGYCPAASAQMYQVYNMGYEFEYVTLVANKNTYANGRCGELGVTGYPTACFDGGYIKIVGQQSNYVPYQNAVITCGSRSVANVDIDLDAYWMGGGQIQVNAQITNNGGSAYNGHLHVYVTEKTSRWNDASGTPYHFAMINNYAINQNIQVSGSSSQTYSNLWTGYTDISMSNIRVIASVFSQTSKHTDETEAADPVPPNSNPPSTPSQPSGPSSGYVGIDYTYSTSSTEVNGDSIKYGWDWNADNTVDEWTDYYPSGQTVQTSHSWGSVGTYNIQVKAQDIFGDESSFSSKKQVDIAIGDPPQKPSAPSGETDGMHGRSYTYTTSTTDPNLGDKIYYKFDWDDSSSSNWVGPYNSGQTASAYHIWDEAGVFDIKVKAKDLAGSESSWSSTTTVEMGNTAPDTPRRPEGPSSGIIGILYTYTTYSKDPERDDVEYLFEWGDATNSGWVQVPSASHAWLEPGEYAIRVKARDQWDESGWSTYKSVVFDEGTLSVDIQVDPDIALVGEEVQFNTIPSGGSAPFTYNWDFGDGNTSTLENPTHIYGSMGQFIVSVSVQDNIGAYGSNYTTVDILLTHPPDIPIIIDGPNETIVGQTSEYSFSLNDPDSDDVYLMVDWGDDSESEWHGPYSSGEEVSLSHFWETDDVYEIKAKVKDTHEYESDWSQSYQVNVKWNQAFIIGSHEIIGETNSTTEFKAISVLYLSSDPFKLKFYSNEETIIVSKDSTGFIGNNLIFGKFLVAYIAD